MPSTSPPRYRSASDASIRCSTRGQTGGPSPALALRPYKHIITSHAFHSTAQPPRHVHPVQRRRGLKNRRGQNSQYSDRQLQRKTLRVLKISTLPLNFPLWGILPPNLVFLDKFSDRLNIFFGGEGNPPALPYHDATDRVLHRLAVHCQFRIIVFFICSHFHHPRR